MEQVDDVTDSFDVALRALQDSLHDARRQLASWSLTNFPNRATLNQQAAELRRTLGAASVEVNAINSEQQITVAGAPKVIEQRAIPVRDSLCVLTAGIQRPLAIDDLHAATAVECHPTRGCWHAWASAPITINQTVAGTVCALEKDHLRHWTREDQFALEDMAARIGRMVDKWSGVS